MNRYPTPLSTERGFSMITALLMTLVLLIITLASTRNSLFSERTAGNLKRMNDVNVAAEYMLNLCSSAVRTGTMPAAAGAAAVNIGAGVYLPEGPIRADMGLSGVVATKNWWDIDSGAWDVSNGYTLFSSNDQGSYPGYMMNCLVENLEPVADATSGGGAIDIAMFRISAYAQHTASKAETLLQLTTRL